MRRVRLVSRTIVTALLLGAVQLLVASAAAPEEPHVDDVAPAPAEDEATLRRRKLAEDFSDPLTTLPQVFMQDAFTPINFGTDGRGNRVILRAIVPRIPRFTLLPLVQLLRRACRW